MAYKNLAPFSDTRRDYCIHWELVETNRLEIWLKSNPYYAEVEQIYISISGVLAVQTIAENNCLLEDTIRNDKFRGDGFKSDERPVLREVTSPFWDDVCQIYPDKELHHYYIISSEFLLDILSEEEPIVRKLEKNEWRDFEDN